MWRIFALILVVFLLVSCSIQNPASNTEKSYRLLVGNPHNPPTFNIFVDEEFVAFMDTSDIIFEIGNFPESSSTHFQSFFADSKYHYELHEDMTISTIDCDSIIWILCGIFEVYYEE